MKARADACISDPACIPYSRREEAANALTHALGVALSIAGLAVLVTFAALNGDAWRVVSVSIYGATLVLLYLASTLYHAARSPGIKHKLRIFDHAAIYLLIAGTYTPFTLVNLRGPWGWSLFGVIWGLATIGVLHKVFFAGRFRELSVVCYIGMGWLVMIAMKPLTDVLPLPGVAWLVVGGVLYTSGVLFYALRRMPYHHAVWHLFVLAGSVCHFISVMGYVVPMRSEVIF
jgi:hemolysin III